MSDDKTMSATNTAKVISNPWSGLRRFTNRFHGPAGLLGGDETAEPAIAVSADPTERRRAGAVDPKINAASRFR